MKTTQRLLMTAAFVFGTLFSINYRATAHPTAGKPVEHAAWSGLLKKYVDAKGVVNYAGFKKDSDALKKYLELLSANAPDESSWSKDEQLAYWINAYNAFTVQLILDNYPVASIKDIGAKIKIPFVNTPWDVKFITIGGKKMDLNNIEHGIIRKKFAEPRIHFALVCAAKSCPPLRNEAYTADRLNAQLDDQGRDFLNDPTKNEVTEKSAEISKILSWYGGDFTKTMPMVDWLNKYANKKMSKDGSISYKTYNWELNGK